MPSTWRDKVLAGDRVTALARGLHATGSGAGGGHPEGWPHDRFLHAWWVEPGRLLAGEYPGHTDAVRARHKVDLLVDTGIRTFVDLTTPADRLDPTSP